MQKHTPTGLDYNRLDGEVRVIDSYQDQSRASAHSTWRMVTKLKEPSFQRVNSPLELPVMQRVTPAGAQARQKTGQRCLLVEVFTHCNRVEEDKEASCDHNARKSSQTRQGYENSAQCWVFVVGYVPFMPRTLYLVSFVGSIEP